MEKITPQTKVADLLNSHPELEDELIRIAPAFSKLKNPILRKTVAKVTSLNQAAIIGNIKIKDLMERIYSALGLEYTEFLNDNIDNALFIKPEWMSDVSSTIDLNAADLLTKNENPLVRVLEEYRKININQVIKIQNNFIPAPMIDEIIKIGGKCWINKINDGEYFVYFIKTR